MKGKTWILERKKGIRERDMRRMFWALQTLLVAKEGEREAGVEGFVTKVVDKERARELCCYFVGWRCVIRGWGDKETY